MVLVAVLDATSDGGHNRVISRIGPCLKVIARNPNDIREVLISLAKVPPIASATICAVRECYTGPITRLERVQQQLDTVRGGHPNDRIHVPEIRLVRRCQIINVSGEFVCKRKYAIQQAAIGSPIDVRRAKQLDP